jgi:hypothetical protein
MELWTTRDTQLQAYFTPFRCVEGVVVVVERMFPQGSYDFLLSGIFSINDL